jgi:predicted transcriptional regulator
MPQLDLSIDNPQALQILKALASETRFALLQKLGNKLSVGELAEKLNQTEANVSAQIKILEKAGLVTSNYVIGHHGVKKIVELVVNTISITL